MVTCPTVGFVLQLAGERGEHLATAVGQKQVIVFSFLHDAPHGIAGPIIGSELVFEKGGPPQVNGIHASSPLAVVLPLGIA
jgi:hypothetical protein